MEDRDKILDYAKPVRLPDDCSKNRKNFTQGYFYREIGRYKNAVPSEFQWAAEDKLINKSTYEELKCQLPDSPRSTFLMVFSPDGKKVASTHGNHNVYVTDLTTGKNIQTLSGHPRTPWCIAFHPSSNQILASGCLGGQVRVWDLHGGSEVWTAESQTVIASLAFHPVDRMLVIATYNELHFWDWSQPEPFAKCSTKSGREKVRYVSFDRLGNKLITGIANPVNVPSQWDRISMVNSQPPMTSTTTSTTSSNSSPATTIATSQPSNDQRSLTSWYRNFMNRYNQLVSMSRNTPTIDRGTDPMDLIDLRNSGNNSESNTNNPSPSTSNSQSGHHHPSSPLRFKITRSACRSYRPLSLRSSIHSSVLRRLRSRSSHSSGSLAATTTTTTTTASTSVSSSSVITTSSSVTSSSTSSPSMWRRCQFSLCPAARSWCLTLGPENSSLFSTRNSSQSTASSGAVTNPTYTSYSDSGISSTRESTSSYSERPQFSMRPYRVFFGDNEEGRLSRRHSDREDNASNRNHFERRSISLEHRERLGLPRQNAVVSPDRSPNRESTSRSPGEGEIERELQRTTSGFHFSRQESESSNSSSISAESLSSMLQLTPEDSRSVGPRRFREEVNSDGELTSSIRRENQSAPQSLMHPIPLPRFQVRSRLVQDQQSQLHLLTNRETHGLNLQNNQNLRRQLSFRPGGQFVLSRHSNSPFQPRVPHQMDSSTQMNSPTCIKSNAKNLRPEIPSLRSSFTTSVSPSTSDSATPTTSSTGNNTSVASNLSFTGEGTSRQVPEQINRRLFDRVKMLLRDRIRNSSENASADSTVNYSRISGESEDPTHLLDTSLESEEGNEARGLGPRGVDPMLSSTSENLDISNETLLLPSTASAGNGSSNNDLPQSELLDPWESETDTVPFSLNSPLSMHDILSDQPQPVQESRSHEVTETAEQNPTASASNNEADVPNSPSPEFSMRQGIQLLSLHIENMQQLCLARIEILHFQKIRRMWENLTKQIHYFHNAIQNRSSRETSERSSNSSNSREGIPRLRNLAINTSYMPEPSAPPSSELDIPDDSLANGLQLPVESNSESSRNKRPNFSIGSAASQSEAGHSSRNETEEPQPGPSGLSAPNTSRNVRNSILHLEYRVYRLVRDIIQETRRRRDLRAPSGGSPGLQRQNFFRIRNTLRMKFRGHRHNRQVPESVSRFITRSREMKAFRQNSRSEKLPKSNQPTPSTSNADSNQPSTSAPINSDEACQCCGQKKKPLFNYYYRSKRRSIDSVSDPSTSGSATKVLKNNVGERRVAPSRETPEENSSNSSTSREPTGPLSETQNTSPNELLRHMLETMETMLRFQREAFRRTKELTGGRSARQQPPVPSSGDDSDSDRNDSNEQIEEFMKDLRRAKRLLGFMVKSLNQFFGENFSNLNQVLDEQIFSLYMLLDLALELTDLLLDHLNARSRDLERSWTGDNPESNITDNRERRGSLPRTPIGASRMRERSRHFGRSSHNPPYGSSREDYLRYKMSFTPLLPSFSRLISTRLHSLGSNSSHGRIPSSLLSSYCRRKRRPPRMPTFIQNGWYSRGNRSSHSATSASLGSRVINPSPMSSHYRSFRHDRRCSRDQSSSARLRAFDYEINNNSSNNDTNNNSSINDNRNSNSNNDNNRNGGSDNSNNSNNINNNFINYYFPNNSGNNSSDSSNNNIIIVTGLNSGNDITNSGNMYRNNNTEINNSGQSGSNVFLNQNPRPPLRSMELTLSRNESGDLSLRDERPIFWIRYGGNNESSGSTNSNDNHSRVGTFTVPVVQVNDVPVSDASMLNQPRHRPQSPVPRVPEDIWRWRAWRPRFLHPRYGGPNPFDDQDSNDVPENIHYYRILSTSATSLLGVHTLDPMIITDAPLSPHHRIQAWDFSKMNIPDISDREANGVVPECKIHNDASVDVSNDGHLLVTLLPSGRLSVTTMLGVYSLDWSSLGQLLYRTSFEQNAVSVSLSPTNRHLLVGLASRPVVVRDRTNMAQIFRLEGGKPSPIGGCWQSARGRLVHMRDLEQTREPNTMSLNCIRWAPGAGQGLVYGTNTGQLKVLR